MGTIVDARKGRVRLFSDLKSGRLQSADFYEGLFKVVQKRALAGLTELQLFGGSFAKCPRVRLVKPSAKKPKSVRHLWGVGKGRFRTIGRYCSATLSGTTWLMDDRCNGTLTRVPKGSVTVRDFVKRRTSS